MKLFMFPPLPRHILLKTAHSYLQLSTGTSKTGLFMTKSFETYKQNVSCVYIWENRNL